MRNSGYWGKNTSAIKTLFGVSSRVEIVSLYSILSCGLTRIVPGFSVIAWLSDHFARMSPAGILQINFDSLVRRKVERHRTLGQICQRHFDSELANFRQVYGLRRDLEIESEPAQPWIFVLRDHVGRKWMENAAQPIASPRRRRWRRILAKDAPGHKQYQKEQNNAALHERA